MRPRISAPTGGLLLGFPDVTPPSNPEPAWALLATEDTPRPAGVPAACVRELDRLDYGRATVEPYVDHLLSALARFHGQLAVTPGGVSWLDVHRVPVRRLLRQVVRKLLALSAWPPFGRAPHPITNVEGGAFVGEREFSGREYRAYTLTWPGIAYILGAPSGPDRLDEEPAVVWTPAIDHDGAGLLESVEACTPQFIAVSWSRRHVETLVPVLNELGRRSRRCLVVDLASDPAEAFPPLAASSLVVRQLPASVLGTQGGVPSPLAKARWSGATVSVGSCVVLVDRLASVVASVLKRSAGCTQPSWAATVKIESLLSNVLREPGPRVLVCCNDTSPLGYLAVRTADSSGVDTVYTQHGAWIGGEVAWPALHSRHVVLMGDRDKDLIRDWARHPNGAVYVLGQPRFDALAAIDRNGQRDYLRALLGRITGQVPERIAVMATQPGSAERVSTQLATLVDGLKRATHEWGVVVAPHPAQRHEVLERVLHELCVASSGDAPVVALTDLCVGAQDCLAGADALLTVSSTCGIEALLLDVPVLELAFGAERTLGLGEYGVAQVCTCAYAIAAALDRAPLAPLPPDEAKNAVCRWDGRTAARVADLLEGCVDVSGH